MVETVIERTKVRLTGRGVADPRERSFDISVTAEVDVDATTARRRVTAWLVSEVGNLIGGGAPVLSIVNSSAKGQRRTVWRVPAVLTSPREGVRGQIGVVEVDAITGDVLSSPILIETLLANANILAHRDTSQQTDS